MHVILTFICCSSLIHYGNKFVYADAMLYQITHKRPTLFRFFTDLSRNYGLFSMATPSHSNEFVLFKVNDVDVIRMHARDGGNDFLGLSFPLNTWHSMCATWGSDDGLAQLWLDGKPGPRRFIHSGQPITGAPITILGQEQDSYGGGFDSRQSFIGMISDVHMWDYVLSPCEIQRYVNDLNFTPGNVFNWRALDFQITGKVLVENKLVSCNNVRMLEH